MKTFILAISLALTSTSVGAQGSNPCGQYMTTYDIEQCLEKTLKARDNELNSAYQQLIKSFRPLGSYDKTNYPAVRKHLMDAQLAWIKFRDNDCRAKYTLWEEGTIRGIKSLSCRIDHTELRTQQLKAWRRP